MPASYYKKDVTTLLNVPPGKCARLASVGDRLRVKLRQYGLHVGDHVRVVRSAPIGGPLVIEVNGREIALGRAVAEKILVEVECESR